MLRNREEIGGRASEAVRRDEGVGRDGRTGCGSSRPRRRRGILTAIVVLTVAGVTACGADSTDRARADGDAASGSVGSTASVARPERGETGAAMLVANRRRAAEPVTEPETMPADPAPPANVSYSDAESVFRSGEYEEAADLFDAYTVRRPENPWGHYMLGISAWRAGDHERAEAALRRTIEVDPTHVKGLLNLARVLLEQREASDALDYVEQVVDLKPESGDGWRVLGNARSDLGMADEAIEAYRDALVLNHRDAWTMNNLGLLMIREGRYEDALPPLARATNLRPDVAIFQNNLGLALERSGHGTEAAEAFRAALLADSAHDKARVSLERVESRVAPTSAEPLDLAGLADAFAAEIDRWKEHAPGADSVRTQGAGEPRDTVRMPGTLERQDAVKMEDTVKTQDTVKVPGAVKLPDTVEVRDTVRTHGRVPSTTPRG